MEARFPPFFRVGHRTCRRGHPKLDLDAKLLTWSVGRFKTYMVHLHGPLEPVSSPAPSSSTTWWSDPLLLAIISLISKDNDCPPSTSHCMAPSRPSSSACYENQRRQGAQQPPARRRRYDSQDRGIHLFTLRLGRVNVCLVLHKTTIAFHYNKNTFPKSYTYLFFFLTSKPILLKYSLFFSLFVFCFALKE